MWDGVNGSLISDREDRALLLSSNKIKLHGFNNLTKSLSFNIYDVCFAPAEQQQAYTLVDIATWLKQRNALSLELILAKGDLLENTYSVILLDKEKFPQLNHQSAEQFVSWLRSKKARKLIEGMAIDNERLFYFTD